MVAFKDENQKSGEINKILITENPKSEHLNFFCLNPYMRIMKERKKERKKEKTTTTNKKINNKKNPPKNKTKTTTTAKKPRNIPYAQLADLIANIHPRFNVITLNKIFSSHMEASQLINGETSVIISDTIQGWRILANYSTTDRQRWRKPL